MRRALRILGNALIFGSLLGCAVLAATAFSPAELTDSPVVSVLAVHFPAVLRVEPRAATTSGIGERASTATPLGEAQRPITHLRIPSIDLDADVVNASIVPLDGGFTWQVPAFKVGHAETTAGAGQPGNAVLLGHVTSVHSGNVFEYLNRVTVGDRLEILSDNDELTYDVTSTSAVPRNDTSVLEPTDTPTITLITCTGIWLPTIWDYTERLVVRAELSQ